jgi:hypothetical protein
MSRLLHSFFWNCRALNVSSRFHMASFSSASEKNSSSRSAAVIHEDILPTLPSTLALSLGWRTLAGTTAVP